MSSVNVGVNTKEDMQEKLQKFGRFLSGMIMPNIGALLAWGIITALFIPAGWIPNAKINELVTPTAHYLIPLLIGFTGGKKVGGIRGGVLGAIGTMGIIAGAPEIHQFMGSMIMGPLGGYIIKKFDEAVKGKVPAGFEMLVDNFSLGIIGTIFMIFGLLGIGPVVATIVTVMKGGVQSVVNLGLLPLVSLFIEPAKILFLNNAINHGILDTLGAQQVAEVGKSIMLLLETNPGPGLGVLLAVWIFGKGVAKESASGAIIIHFLGGIHEIYFPFILMKPILLLATIAGGVSGVFTFTMLDAGLAGPAAPGSIVALIAMAPKGGLIPVLAGVFVSTVVSFVVASFFVKRDKNSTDESDLEEAKNKMQELKERKKVSSDLTQLNKKIAIKEIIFACDAGVGSSAMGATTLKRKLNKAGLNIEVTNCAVDEIPKDSEVVITHENLERRAKASAPNAIRLTVKDFINNDVFEQILDIIDIQDSKTIEYNEEDKDSNSILRKSNIKLNLKANDKYEAIRAAGCLLVEGGYVEEEYIPAMIDRENDISTYIGQGIAIPHGVGAAKEKIINSGMVVLQYPEGVMFDEELAYIVVGIAGVGDKHLSILANIATAIGDADEEILNNLRYTQDTNYIYELFTK
ncbi:PTS mannitol transporter subunit IICBA [Clostridium intestinale]|nr:PTS mannitol transporter subunit IICBA [Clostridium intestinale]